MSEEPTADELEFLGDEAAAAGQLSEALNSYLKARRLLCDAIVFETPPVTLELASITASNATMKRVNQKIRDISAELCTPPKPLTEQIAGLRSDMDEFLMDGYLGLAVHVSIQLGAAFDELEDRDEAESAYRTALALARQVDATDPELLLHAFWSLIDFLPPSEESLALAREMASNLIDRAEIYNPMRAADAAHLQAIAELDFAEITPHHVDSAINGVAQQAVVMLDDVCLHDRSQDLRRQVAAVLRAVGRNTEAESWQAAADRYEDWDICGEQVIPGHVHLWDIRGY